LKDQSISSDELVEVCGASGSGKTYFCLKLVSHALLEKNVAVLYIDTSNYVNSDNMTLVLKVSLNLAHCFAELHHSKRQVRKGRDCQRSAEAFESYQGVRLGAAICADEHDSVVDAEQASQI
jgi:uridine kinase